MSGCTSAFLPLMLVGSAQAWSRSTLRRVGSGVGGESSGRRSPSLGCGLIDLRRNCASLYGTERPESVRLPQRCPAGFALDVRIIEETGRTSVVEVNDGYALGRYGLDAEVYFDLLSERWRELVA
jgi:ATP-grasp domain, R2K clade family 3